MKRSTRIGLVTSLALTGGLLAMAPVMAQAGTAHPQPATAASASPSTSPSTWTFPTKVPNVPIRVSPSSGAKAVGVVKVKGASVAVSCYLTAGTKVWFKTVTPKVGYIAGRALVYPHAKGTKVPTDVPTCAAG